MLKELWIKNLAIIDDLKVGFEEGLNVLTGETGTGKSIIVDSLNLVFGSRAQAEFVRSGEKEAVIQAYFEVGDPKDFPEMGIDATDGLIIRRSVSSAGKSRAYINDIQVSMQGLSEVGRSLIDIHGQHEHQSLLSVEKHRFFLDSFGKLHGDRRSVEGLYSDVSGLKEKLLALKQKAEERTRRMDFLRFQVAEIDTASLKAGEKERLAEERSILSNVNRLKQLAEEAYDMIYGSDGSCVERLSSVLSDVKDMSAIDQGAVEIQNLIESALPLIEDASVALRNHKDKYDIDPMKLNEIEERLELIKKLEKKYGEGIDAVLLSRNGAVNELESLEQISEALNTYEAELAAKEKSLLEAAGQLSEKRRDTAGKMETLVNDELKELAFGHPEFVIDIRPCGITTHGSDSVEFLFSANPGEQPKPLMKIASGGELSRVMLALKSMFAEYDSIPVLIFDEVDAGIGGKTAERVGERLRKLSSRHQVLCATHLPQIASLADFHLKVEKIQKNNRVFVEVKEVSGEERMSEIARMLSGTITGVSLKHAKELLDKSSEAARRGRGANRTARKSEKVSGLFS
jgi:DNA repair protein RecN (Recombination protein N)